MTSKRPPWVTIIAVITIVTSIIGMLTVVAGLLLPADDLDIEPLTTFDFVSGAVFATAAVIAAVYLLKLSKLAFYWFAIPFAAWLALSGWDVLAGRESVFDPELVAYFLFGLVVNSAICIYCWTLVRKGVLT